MTGKHGRGLREKGNYIRTSENVNGQIEKREYYQTDETGWLTQKKKWNGIKSLEMEEKRIRDKKGKRKEYRYYISSLAPEIETFKRAVGALECGEYALAPGCNL